MMAKKILNDVQKKKIMKRRNKKLIHKVVHYLKSDSYLFAPLISSKPSNSFKPRRGIEIREQTKDNRSLMKKIKEYLKSDCYMYASLVLPQSSTISPKHDKLVKESAENRTFKAAEQQKKLVRLGIDIPSYKEERERMVFDHRIRKIVVD